MKATSFQYEVYVPFHLGDPAGILFFGHVFSLTHEAFENFIVQELGIPWNDWFQNGDYIVPIKQTEANFLVPIKSGKPCTIDLTISEVRNSSFSVSYRLFQDDVECCQLKTVHVFCNRKTLKKQDIPAAVRQKIERSG